MKLSNRSKASECLVQLKFARLVTCILLAAVCSFSFAADNQSFDVDEADSFDFEEFHKTDPDASSSSVREFLLGSDQVDTKAYAQANPNTLPGIPADQLLIASSLLDINNIQSSVSDLYAAMLKNCPDGFIKRREWTQKDVSRGTLILQYEYNCQK